MTWKEEIKKENQDKFLQDLVKDLQSVSEGTTQAFKKLESILMSTKYLMILRENKPTSYSIKSELSEEKLLEVFRNLKEVNREIGLLRAIAKKNLK